MLALTSDITGKQSYYGYFKRIFEQHDFHICGNWEYYEAYFDCILYQREGVSIYLRVPAEVIDGKLDDDNAYVRFGEPFMIKHIMHAGLLRDDLDFSMLDTLGLNQFQKPVDPDDRIKYESKWRQVGDKKLNEIIKFVQ